MFLRTLDFRTIDLTNQVLCNNSFHEMNVSIRLKITSIATCKLNQERAKFVNILRA